MAENLDLDQIERAARAALEDKVSSVRALAAAQQHRVEAQAAYDAADGAHSAAWSDAIGKGWTPLELRKVGLDEPGKKVAARRRSGAARPRPAQAPAPASASAPAGNPFASTSQPGATSPGVD